MADAARCDYCSTHADRTRGADRLGRFPAPPPDGWVAMSADQYRNEGLIAGIERGGVTGEFCSWACAAQFMSAHALGGVAAQGDA